MADQDAIRRYVDDVTVEPEAIERARAHALELGADPISPAVGAQIAVIAAATAALNVVEIGTGAGVSGLWLLRAPARLSPPSTRSPSTWLRRARHSPTRKYCPLAPVSSRAAPAMYCPG
jgi:hypothetical protein